MTDLWSFLGDAKNQATLSWLGGGLVVLAGGAWAVLKFLAGQEETVAKPVPLPGRATVRADHGSIAGGGKVSVRSSRGLSGLHVILLVGVVVGAILLASGLLGKRTAATNGVAAGGDIRGSTINVGTSSSAPAAAAPGR